MELVELDEEFHSTHEEVLERFFRLFESVHRCALLQCCCFGVVAGFSRATPGLRLREKRAGTGTARRRGREDAVASRSCRRWARQLPWPRPGYVTLFLGGLLC